MSAIRSFEEVLLAPAEKVIVAATADVPLFLHDEARLQILEAAAAQRGGFDYHWFSELTAPGTFQPVVEAKKSGEKLNATLQNIPIHPALALSSLARPDLSQDERRSSGAYYTDFRLAQYLTASLKSCVPKTPRILDPASGTGILLVAAVIALSGDKPKQCTSLIAESIYAADLSPSALRGAALALSSFTKDKGAIVELLKHLRPGDSLVKNGRLWKDIAPNGFDVVLANPPWEKLKISRHELLQADGIERHYGAEYDDFYSASALDKARKEVAEYVSSIDHHFTLQGSGERDLYKLFTELAFRLTHPGGHVFLLVPAGLIRSLGTRNLREFLLEKSSSVEFTVLENRARFFAIDTRFKFLALRAQLVDGKRRAPIEVISAVGEPDRVVPQGKVSIARSTLRRIRPDLSIPEVRSEAEWKVFQDVTLNGERFGAEDGVWQPLIMREVDMTNDRKYFQQKKKPDSVPVVEGRMLHQYRHSVKHYVSGTGRSAVWRPVAPIEKCEIKPQFWFPIRHLPDSVMERVETQRVGFCDITGQTNERTMLASRIPAGVVCGNKVPTIIFNAAYSQRHMADYWLAVVNSFLFDWMSRRVITTTVNFFLLLDLPFPKIAPMGSLALRLSELAAMTGDCDARNPTTRSKDMWAEAEIRAEIDWRVLQAYGHGLDTMRLVTQDFPLIDRAQPALKGEDRSTITRDFLLLRTAKATGEGSSEQVMEWQERVEAARLRGAVPYVPTHLNS